MASGINSTFRQVGIATGIAGLGAIFQHEVLNTTTRSARRAAAARSWPRARAARTRCFSQAESSSSFHTLSPAARSSLNHAYRSASPKPSTTSCRSPRRSRFVGAVLALRARTPAATSSPRSRPRDTEAARRRRAAERRRALSAAARGVSRPASTGLRRRQSLVTHSLRRRARADADSADRLGRSASACTARTPSRACWARAGGACTSSHSPALGPRARVDGPHRRMRAERSARPGRTAERGRHGRGTASVTDRTSTLPLR